MRLPSPAVRILIGLLFCDIVIIILHTLFARTLGFFDLDKEQSLKAVFSGFQLLTGGWLALGIAWLFSVPSRKSKKVILWSVGGALLLALALDDMMMIHERIGFVLNLATGLRGSYESFNWLLYFSPLIIGGVVLFFFIIRSLFSFHRISGWYALIGVGCFIGTLAMEGVGVVLLKNGLIEPYLKSIIIEESLLLIGGSFFLVGLFSAYRFLFSSRYLAREEPLLLPFKPLPSALSYILKTVKWFFVFLCGGGVSFILISLALPIFSLGEQLLGVPLPYEAVIRIAFFCAALLLLACALPLVIKKKHTSLLLVWIVLFGSFLLLSGILFFDTRNRLMEEYSWIRITTSVFLFCAGVAMGTAALHEWKKRDRAFSLSLALLSLGFFFGGLDEVFQIHETLGATLEKTFRLSHVTTDLLTIFYGIVALIIVGSVVVLSRKRFSQDPFPFCVIFFGVMIYGSSTLLDTLDSAALPLLKAFAVYGAAHPSFIFTDHFTLLWAPRNFLNGLEEVLEHTAAALFFASGLLFVVHAKKITFPLPRLPFVHGFSPLIFVLGVFLVGDVFGIASSQGTGPLQEERRAQRIAGPQEGLFHADDLFYHPAWGLLIANEGGGSVLRLDGKTLQPLPDPNHLLSDIDSVTASQTTVYASSGAAGTIYRYTKEKGWSAAWTKKDGLAAPEGLAVDGDILYSLDESQRTITRLEQKQKAIVWRVDHPDWRAPEGVTFDENEKALFVTDDESGAVFRLTFSTSTQSIEKIARLEHPEDITLTPNGALLIADNGLGAVLELSRTGETLKKIPFKRAYRDLQGIATDGKQIFVITSDGWGQGSFMPSFLFALEK